MRFPVALVRQLSLAFKNLRERSDQLWTSDRRRDTQDWATAQLKEAYSRVRSALAARPGVFWAALLGSLPLVIVFALFMTGNAGGAWPPLATFGTALGATIVAIATLMRHFAQTDADRQRRIVETFSKAVEQLGSDKLEVRTGAIFGLERLSKESPDDYWAVMEVLTAFVRDRMRYTTIMARLSDRAYFLWLQAGRPEGRSEEFWRQAIRLEQLEQTPTDVAAIFTVFSRRSPENRLREAKNDWRFDLRRTYLSNVELQYGYFDEADFFGAHLDGAWLVQAHLRGANLFEARLESANLVEAHLQGAVLSRAHLERASLFGAHLESASLLCAHLERADLREAHLEGADLSTAEGLTHDQLLSAHGDRNTKLPNGIARPRTWPF